MAVLGLKLILFLVFAGLLPSLALVLHLTVDNKRFNLFDRLIVAAILSPLVLVLVSFIEEVLGVPQSPLMLSVNLAVLALLNGYLVIRYYRRRQCFNLNISWFKLLAYLLFAAVFVFKVLPAFSLLTPLLHDAISHSQWLKELNTSHYTTTEQWYPQGLEYYLNYFATYFDYSYPRIILMAENIFLATLPVGMFYLGLLLVRESKKYFTVFPVAIFVVSASARIPSDLYFTAGKNSMIFAFCSAPVIFYIAYAARKRYEYLLAALLIFASIVIHYPTGFFIAFIFIFFNLYKVLSLERLKINVDRGQLYGSLAALAAFACLGAMLLYKLVPIYRAHPPYEDKSVVGVKSFIATSGIWNYVGENFYLREVALLGICLSLLFVASLSVFAFTGDGGDRRTFIKRLVLAYVTLYALGIVLMLPENKVTGIFYSFEIQFFLILVLVPVVAWFITYLARLALEQGGGSGALYIVIPLLLSAIFLYNGNDQYNEYRQRQDGLHTTTQADIEAFEFINSEIEDDKKILIQLSNGNDLIMGADSGVWIPSFTDKEVEVNFAEYANPDSYEVFDLYAAVAEDGRDLLALKKLYCDYDVGYIYFGSRKVFSDNMQKEKIEGSEYLDDIYDNGASIFRITGVSCD